VTFACEPRSISKEDRQFLKQLQRLGREVRYPRGELEAALREMGVQRVDVWGDEELVAALAQAFGTTVPVIALRLKELGLYEESGRFW
jgi:hypothetical protein